MTTIDTQLAGKNTNGAVNGSAKTSAERATPKVEFPFESKLDFSKLIEFWTSEPEAGCTLRQDFGVSILKHLENAPELHKPIEDPAMLDKHKNTIAMLFSALIPPASWDTTAMAAIAPFGMRAFFSTDRFRQRLLNDNDGLRFEQSNISPAMMNYGRTWSAYSIIGRMFYGLNVNLEYPFVFWSEDPKTGLIRYDKVTIDGRFVDIKVKGKLKKLTAEEKKLLTLYPDDIALWKRLIPPENFVFQGFNIMTGIDITDQEVLSSLKKDLIEKDAIDSQTKFMLLQQKIRSLLKKPDAVMGIAALRKDKVYLLNYGGDEDKKNMEMLDEEGAIPIESIKGEAFLSILHDHQTLAVTNVKEYPHFSDDERAMLGGFASSIVLAPLIYEGELIGVFKIESPHVGDLSAMNTMKLHEILPLFALALKRNMEEAQSQAQAIIKEKCTAIHPAVEWKFDRAAVRYMRAIKTNPYAELEPIVFENVYPMYALSDIRSSSEQRNLAIQADLLEHLRLARSIIHLARNHRTLPILDDYDFRLNKQIHKVDSGVGSGDELSVLEFLRKNIEPVFDHIEAFGEDVADRIREYHATVDQELGIVYRKRKEFDESVTTINDAIAAYLDKEQVKAQATFPHYFEKYKTDGVDYSAYIGASLLEDGNFDILYLKNLRLWQLLTTCGIIKLGERLKDNLALPLETAHLILVQDAPLAIRFRLDEKQFDVDGAYNIRYEIIKKRIDKAVVKDTGERLTKPGHIAIVYSQLKEAQEYREYIEYLQSAGHLTETVEEFELEDMPGVRGLKALRVEAVITETAAAADEPTVPARVEEAIRAMTAEKVLG